MKAFLMYRDRDFDPEQALPPHAPALMQDLGLETLFNGMALGDKYLFEIAKVAVLTSMDNDLATIRYRQDILKDCLKNAAVVKGLYDLAGEAIAGERKIYWGVFSKHPDAILHRAIEVLRLFLGLLMKLRSIADQHADEFESEGFTRFFAMIREELSPEYFASVKDHLRQLQFRGGVLISAELGRGNKGTHYVLRRAHDKGQRWIARTFAARPAGYTIHIADRDESGARALAELRDRGINLVANALAQSTDHILGFFTMLRAELAFYIGCLNLHDRLAQKGEPMSFPLAMAPDERVHSFSGLCDVCLALLMDQRVVGNDLKADHKGLVIITGANQGGKSTFLRSIGLAQLMMQAGMFVPAESFCANVCDGLFTHYRREEDVTMTSGKLDEELGRLSDIVDHMSPNSLLLLNESFAATNEREGSEIARQVVSALVEKRIKVFFVTHLYAFARGFYEKRPEGAIFLQPERSADGTRTYRIIEGEPSQTSYGEDLYYSVFGSERLDRATDHEAVTMPAPVLAGLTEPPP